jgi:serine/threonine protein kinase
LLALLIELSFGTLFRSDLLTPYPLQELVSSGSLLDCLQPNRPHLTALQRLQILRGVAYGMLVLHSADIIHMDIKPANILLELLGADTIPKLADFGISKSLDPTSTFAGSTNAAGCGGSLMWMSPELIQHPPAPSPASDVYAFGMVIYEMFAGCKPWDMELQASNVSPVMIPAWVVSGSRPSIPSHVTQPVASLIQRCWHAIPASRPDASEIIDAISQLTELDCTVTSSRASYLPIHVADAAPAAPSMFPSTAAAFVDVVENELQEMVSEMMQLKMGVRTACVAAARSLAGEGVMSLEELRPLTSAKARALLEKSGLKEMQIDKVLGAYCPSHSPPPPLSSSPPPPASFVASTYPPDAFHDRTGHAFVSRRDSPSPPPPSSSPPPGSSSIFSSRVGPIGVNCFFCHSGCISCSMLLTRCFQAGKPDIIKAVESGDNRLLLACLTADPACINQRDKE